MKRSRLTTATVCLTLAMAGCSAATTATSASNQDQPGSESAPLIGTLSDVAGPITPGWYFLTLTGRTSSPYATSAPFPLRAIVQVPPGYSTQDGRTIIDSDGSAPALSVARGISKVDTEPCGGGQLVDPGPSVEDLTDALAPHATTAPRAVTVDGADGFSLEFAPPDDLTQCTGGVYRLLDDRADRTPSTTHLWVLDVEGHRVVATVRTPKDVTQESDQTVSMASNLLFVPVRAPH